VQSILINMHNKKIASAIKSWPARHADPNQLLAVLCQCWRQADFSDRGWCVNHAFPVMGWFPHPRGHLGELECSNRIRGANFLL